MADLDNRGDQDIVVCSPTENKKVDVLTRGGMNRLAIFDGQKKYGLVLGAYLENGGSKEINVDGSVTPVDFTAGPPAGKKWYITKVTVVIEDQAINYTKFGGIVGGITNGVLMKFKEGGTERTVATVNINREFYELADLVTLESSTTDLLIIRFNASLRGSQLELRNADADVVTLTVQDDLTTISSMRMLIQGYEVDE